MSTIIFNRAWIVLRLAVILHVSVWAQNRNQVHEIPFGSSDNTIEIVIHNESLLAAQGVRIAPVDLPDWVKITPLVREFPMLLAGTVTSTTFLMSLDHSSPVGQEQIFRFEIVSATDEKWTKEVTISVGHPQRFELFQNFPNPFNPITKITYTLVETGWVKLVIFNVLGEEVMRLVDGVEEPGYRTAAFDATTLPSGVYFYRLTASGSIAVKKMLMTK